MFLASVLVGSVIVCATCVLQVFTLSDSVKIAALGLILLVVAALAGRSFKRGADSLKGEERR